MVPWGQVSARGQAFDQAGRQTESGASLSSGPESQSQSQVPAQSESVVQAMEVR